MSPFVHLVNERQVSLTVWKKWLYKRLQVCPDLAVGMALLNIGNAPPHETDARATVFYVCEGRGWVTFEGQPEVFLHGPENHDDSPPDWAGNERPRRLTTLYEPGMVLHLETARRYSFECHLPTTLFAVHSLIEAPPALAVLTLQPGERTRFRPPIPYPSEPLLMWNAPSEALFMLSGRGALHARDTTVYLSPGDTMQLATDIGPVNPFEYVLENTTPEDCTFLHATVSRLPKPGSERVVEERT